MPEDKRKKKFRLRKPEVSRVDIVDRGANQHSHILLAKREDDPRMPMMNKKPQVPGQAPASQAPRPQAPASPRPGAGAPQLPQPPQATPSNPMFNRPASPGIGQTPPAQRTPRPAPPTGPGASGSQAPLQGMAGQLQRQQQAPAAQRPASAPEPAGPNDDPEALDMDEDELLMNILRTRMKRRQMSKPPRKPKPQDQSMMAKRLDNTLSLLTKGLISAGVFTQDATAKDLRDILPPDVVSKLTKVSASKSADATHQEGNMDPEEIQALVDELPDEIVDYIGELEDRATQAETDLAKAKGEYDESEVALAKALEGLDPEVAEIVKSQQNRLSQAEKELQAERIAKANESFITKARGFDGVIDKPEDFGPVLREFAEVNPEAAEKLESQLRAASQRVTKSSLFSEFGHEAQTSEVDSEVEAIAKSYVEANPELSLAVARGMAWENNPELYERYRSEKQSR